MAEDKPKENDRKGHPVCKWIVAASGLPLKCWNKINPSTNECMLCLSAQNIDSDTLKPARFPEVEK